MVQRTRPTKAICAIVGGLAAASIGSAGAEPTTLSETELDSVSAAGAIAPSFGFDSGALFDRSTRITTQISMPVSNAVAICLLCSGDASAVAVANAIGTAQSNATALSQGLGDSFALSNAVGSYLMSLVPAAGQPQQPAPPPRKGAGRK